MTSGCREVRPDKETEIQVEDRWAANLTCAGSVLGTNLSRCSPASFGLFGGRLRRRGPGSLNTLKPILRAAGEASAVNRARRKPVL